MARTNFLSLRGLGKPVILAVASAGGHWVQLQRIVPALAGFEIVYVSTKSWYEKDVYPNKFICIKDANRCNKFSLIALFFHFLLIICTVRPFLIISTGAAPGFVALVVGKICGASTIWLDSIANVEEISLSGRMSGKWADLWLTQWQHLAHDKGPLFFGTIV